MRLSGPTARISSGVRNFGDHAYGLDSATFENRDHSELIFTWCWSIVSPAAARRAFSKTGYTWVGTASDRAISASCDPGLSSPRTSEGGVSAGCSSHGNRASLFFLAMYRLCTTSQ